MDERTTNIFPKILIIKYRLETKSIYFIQLQSYFFYPTPTFFKNYSVIFVTITCLILTYSTLVQLVTFCSVIVCDWLVLALSRQSLFLWDLSRFNIAPVCVLDFFYVGWISIMQFITNSKMICPSSLTNECNSWICLTKEYRSRSSFYDFRVLY